MRSVNECLILGDDHQGKKWLLITKISFEDVMEPFPQILCRINFTTKKGKREMTLLNSDWEK